MENIRTKIEKNAKLRNYLDLINKIEKNKLIVVAVRTPYDINVLDVPTYVCAYEASVLSFKALAKYLTGEIEAKGILPVSVK